ncbi:MAG: hypothetical protein A2Y23_15775 [Clostridiales bacterium GWB2_37_7]|nr:MAG: hypothetical protein A2Y23_15775 [Clostridiales bacterium GWB2_37_7]
MNKMYKMMNNRKGFTLIELIVVIAILGILATIAVPRLTGFTEKANIAADEQLVALVNNSLKILEAEDDTNVPGTDDDDSLADIITWINAADADLGVIIPAGSAFKSDSSSFSYSATTNQIDR